MERKYIFVTGGVVSGLGKGITAASLGRLLKSRGLKVAAKKCDPYLNKNPGIMSPYQHGEVFLTDDGTETDLDLGHYERFIDEKLNTYSTTSAGKIYWSVLNKENNGEYDGGTIQIIPHVTNEIKEAIYRLGPQTDADVIITEIGGTVGDIECLPFLEAIRQISTEVGHSNCIFVHVTLVPYISGSNEVKSKPTQHSVKELQSLGISPDLIICRCDAPIDENIRKKISMFCNVKMDCVIENQTVSTLYEAPIYMEERGLSEIVCRELGIMDTKADLSEWKAMIDRIKNLKKKVRIALVGKYVQLQDAYISIAESLKHAGYETDSEIIIDWVDSEVITDENAAEILGSADGIIVPAGFGKRGVDGCMAVAKYARVNNVPYLGMGVGMHAALAEFARNELAMKGADSTEFDKETPYPIIFEPGEKRLGSFPCVIKSSTLLAKCYGDEATANERHRHQHEINPKYIGRFTEGGLVFSGESPDGKLVEAFENPKKAFFLATQFQPEFASRPNHAHPVIKGFIAAAGRKS